MGRKKSRGKGVSKQAPTPSGFGALAPSLEQRQLEPLNPAFRAIWTDGSARNRQGAWAWIDNSGNYAVGSIPPRIKSDSTEAELRGLVEAIRATPEGTVVHVNSDSRAALSHAAPYVRHDIDFGLTSTRYPSLVRELAEACQVRDVTVHWIKGHAGDAWNSAADKLAALGNTVALRDDIPRRSREIVAHLAYRLSVEPWRDCSCIPEDPAVTWARGHVDWRGRPQATLESISPTAFEEDAALVFEAIRTGTLGAAMKRAWAWIILVRHQERQGSASGDVIDELDSLLPGWRHLDGAALALGTDSARREVALPG